MNKRGTTGEIVLSIVLLIVVIGAVFFILGETGIINARFNPETANAFVGFLWKIVIAIKNVLWTIVVPTTLTDINQQVIAFSMFLLLWLIGAHSLKNVWAGNKFLSNGVAFLVALIAGRALNATIIENYVIGSPLAAGAAAIGLIPLFIFYSIMDGWHAKMLTKFSVWLFFGIIYFFIFYIVLNQVSMGLLYFSIILLGALTEIFLPYMKFYKRASANKDLGRFMALTHQDLQTYEQSLAAASAVGTSQMAIKPPWEV